MEERTARYEDAMAGWMERKRRGAEPGKKPTLKHDFNREEQGSLMTHAAKARMHLLADHRRCSCDHHHRRRWHRRRRRRRHRRHRRNHHPHPHRSHQQRRRRRRHHHHHTPPPPPTTTTTPTTTTASSVAALSLTLAAPACLRRCHAAPRRCRPFRTCMSTAAS